MISGSKGDYKDLDQ